MVQASKVETRKQIFKYLSIFLLFLSISVLLSTQAYADGPIDIGGGEGVTGGGEYFDGGYGDWAGGYRACQNMNFEWHVHPLRGGRAFLFLFYEQVVTEWGNMKTEW